MSIAVTGATGFIGRHLLNELAQRGHSATVAVRPSSRSAVPAPHLPVALDIAGPVDDAFEALGRPDVLIHLAWSGLPNYMSRHHLEEVPAQYRFLSMLLRSGLTILVVTGTCLEYGMREGALREDVPAQPVTEYGRAKDELRRQLLLLKQQVPFRLTWARLFYLYGSGQATSSVFSQLSAAVARGDRHFDMSGGEQVRDYLPVETATRHLVTLALLKEDVGIVNVCSGVPVSVRDIVSSWVAENRWAITLNLGVHPYPDYEPMAFWGDRAKLDALLRRPEVPA